MRQQFRLSNTIGPHDFPLEGEPYWDDVNRRLGFWNFAEAQFNWFRVPQGFENENYIPQHQWTGTSLAFYQPNGQLGTPIDLQGIQGEQGIFPEALWLGSHGEYTARTVLYHKGVLWLALKTTALEPGSDPAAWTPWLLLPSDITSSLQTADTVRQQLETAAANADGLRIFFDDGIAQLNAGLGELETGVERINGALDQFDNYQQSVTTGLNLIVENRDAVDRRVAELNGLTQIITDTVDRSEADATALLAASRAEATTTLTNANNAAAQTIANADARYTVAQNYVAAGLGYKTDAERAQIAVAGAEARVNTARAAVEAVDARVRGTADRFLPVSADDPTARADGSALQRGDLVYNTTLGEMRTYNGSQWQKAGSAANGAGTRVVVEATAGQTTFAIAYDVGFVDVYLNGIKLLRGRDFTASNGTSVDLLIPAEGGDWVDMTAFGSFSVANAAPMAHTHVLADIAESGSLAQWTSADRGQAGELLVVDANGRVRSSGLSVDDLPTANYIRTPSNVSPVAGTTGLGANGNPIPLVASPYFNYGTTPQRGRQVRVSTNAAMTAIVYDSGLIAGTTNTYDIPTAVVVTLQPSTQYYWQWRYADTRDPANYSNWSNPTGFVTATKTALDLGDAYAGGFYGGLVEYSGTRYRLVVADKTGGNVARAWKTEGTTTAGTYSEFDGVANMILLTTGLHPAADWCRDFRGGGFADWYLASRRELAAIYINLKPTSDVNNTSNGINPYTVPPRTTNYTTTDPTLTAVGAFRNGGAQAFSVNSYWTSNSDPTSTTAANTHSFVTGAGGSVPTGGSKTALFSVRPIRRVPV